MKLSTVLLLLITMVAFASNSIFCRLALASGSISPDAFTVLRLLSGMLMLLPIILFEKKLTGKILKSSNSEHKLLSIKLNNFWQPLMLFGYAIFFSFAYVQLDTGVGALILFPTVQISMMTVSLFQGNRVTMLELFGFVISLGGLVYLLSPGITAPPLGGTVLMALSGICWAVYSLLGQKVKEPIFATARNFLFATLPVIVFVIILLLTTRSDQSIHWTRSGIYLAIISGAIASGIGYVLWYISLGKISTTAASISQLAVPVLAASGGILFLGEELTSRLIIASILILGGIAITISLRKK